MSADVLRGERSRDARRNDATAHRKPSVLYPAKSMGTNGGLWCSVQRRVAGIGSEDVGGISRRAFNYNRVRTVEYPTKEGGPSNRVDCGIADGTPACNRTYSTG